jgi:hypothetical protein
MELILASVRAIKMLRIYQINVYVEKWGWGGVRERDIRLWLDQPFTVAFLVNPCS